MTELEIGYSKGVNPENHYSVIKNAMGDVVALYDPYGALIGINHNQDYSDTYGMLKKNPW